MIIISGEVSNLTTRLFPFRPIGFSNSKEYFTIPGFFFKIQPPNNSTPLTKIKNSRGTGDSVMKNLGNIMNQAKMMQARLAQIQEEMAKKTVEASSGGGMVTVIVNGRQEILSVKIEPEVVNPDDVEMLQDLVQAAANDALRKAQEMMAQEMAKVTGGLKIPGLL
jgi:DNA-binding YbaB/EbfC family protein